MKYEDTLLDTADPVVVLDPCAGGGATHGMSYPDALARYGQMFDLCTMDIRTDSRAAYTGVDYLKTPIDGRKLNPGVIITNPPFALAEEIIAKALRDVAEDGFVIMLLRLNFFGSAKRFKFITENMPWRVYVHSERIKFIEGKSGDSIEYAHFVWRKGTHPAFSQLKVISVEEK